ncbi:MAG: LPS-assembly protein LptD [Bryobacterales bacterium]|nr:LPS-assembly protein LptD [Bryobacterales bacterium]
MRAASGFSWIPAVGCLAAAAWAAPQAGRPPNLPPPPPPQAAPPGQPFLKKLQTRPNAPPRDVVDVRAIYQVGEGPWMHLRGKAQIETTEMLLEADEVDYNQETGEAEARGNAHFRHFERQEELWAERVEYNVKEETGKFYRPRGSGPVRIDARPGVLTTNAPFYFEGEWAERLKEKYILHNGWITNCRLPKPWWTLRGPKFDIIPGDRALTYRSVFRVRWFPIFYTPFFYKSLERAPRRSGFLTPNVGNSSRRGKMIGIGYYWAINRSYDATYRVQDFTQRGFAHHVEMRGKPRHGSDFDAIFYGVNDRGLKLDNGERRKEGGFNFTMSGYSDLGRGFQARGTVNYLSSLRFRQAFTESFNEAIFSEVHSLGFVNKDWSSYSLNLVFARLENYQSVSKLITEMVDGRFVTREVPDRIVIRKLPQVEFSSRDRRLWKDVPVWISLESTAGLLRRNQPLFQTRQFMERMDFWPRVMAALGWKGIRILPAFSIRETHWGEQQQNDRVLGLNTNRHAREASVDFVLPSLERTFESRGWLGEKLKHVIEPRVSFRHVNGVEDFDRLIRFDETELYSNTTEAEVSLVNRFYAKRNGRVSEVFSWQLWHQRYFDPSFGGAVVQGRRNVVLTSAQLTPYTFLNGPRRYSPVVSAFRASPRPGFGLEWRADYDPMQGKLVNSGVTADARFRRYYVSLGHNQVACVSLNPGQDCADPAVGRLSPSSSQMRMMVGFGDANKRGWNAGFTGIYDYRLGVMQYATTQVTYNTDCCGLSVQYRRFSFGTRNENQFRLAFAIANIGSFGTLKKQERLF